MKMLGWAKGGRLKWVFALVSADEPGAAEGVGVDDAGVGATEASADPASVVDSASALVADSVAFSVSEEASTSGSGVPGAAEAFGCCSIGIARQSTVKISPGFRSVFGLCTCTVSMHPSRQ